LPGIAYTGWINVVGPLADRSDVWSGDVGPGSDGSAQPTIRVGELCVALVCRSKSLFGGRFIGAETRGGLHKLIGPSPFDEELQTIVWHAHLARELTRDARALKL